MRELFNTEHMRKDKLVYYTSAKRDDVTNAIYLRGCFLVCHMHATPAAAWAPFNQLHGIVRPYYESRRQVGMKLASLIRVLWGVLYHVDV
jgi:hypothetical protein